MGWKYRLGRLLGTEPEFRERKVRCLGAGGFHRMAYVEWGDPDNPKVVVCVHGLTRNGRDFDDLARVLSRDYRVVCPDVAGRGRSDWLKAPTEYGFPTYLADMAHLLARLDVEQVDWVGTSMGGLIGMMLAAQPDSPVKRLVLNDVGPLITGESLKRIGEYVGRAPLFDDPQAAENYLRLINAPFGQLTDAQWRHLTVTSIRQRADGQWEMRYDPAIGEPFRQAFVMSDVDLWPMYEAIRCPVLLVRGAESDLLSAATAAAMTSRGPKALLREVPNVGHAPTLMDIEQISLVSSYLSVLQE